MLIDGKAHAASLLQKLSKIALKLRNEYAIQPIIATILVGKDPASLVYVKLKAKRATEIGIGYEIHELSETASEREVLSKCQALNARDDITSILVQLPLPPHIDTFNIINSIDPMKDVDGFTAHNIGLLNSWKPLWEPCTPCGIMMLIKSVLGMDIGGKKAVVLGRSTIVGRPMSAMLLRENCTVTTLHSKTVDIESEIRRADILVAAAGVPGIVKGHWVKPGACVIDVGITKVEGKLLGDVEASAAQYAGYITPVPGGVGPMTIACLLLNTLKAVYARKKHKFFKIY